MQPDAALEELRCAAEGPSTAKSRDDPAGPIKQSISSSYFLLRGWIAILMIALPLVLWFGNGLLPNPSISEYYHSPGGWSRDLFVGVLSAVGFFLYFYKGYSKTEDTVLNIAGICAVFVAFAPMNCPLPACPLSSPSPFPDGTHGFAAWLMFNLLAYVCMFLGKDTLDLLRDSDCKKRFQRGYRVLGVLMIAVPLVVFAIHLLSPGTERSRVMFFIELSGIAVFATFWLLKSREIAEIMDQGQ